MKFAPYLMFNGNCAEAFAFYAEVFGAKIVRQLRYAQPPAGVNLPPGADPDVIMHVCMEKDGFRLMGGDMSKVCEGAAPARAPFCVSVSVDSVEEAAKVANALAEGGAFFMPLGETFFSQQFAMVADRFGAHWMIDCPRAESDLAQLG